MTIIPEMPKLMPFYSNKFIKNIYQPFYDFVNVQSLWIDAISKWSTDINQTLIKSVDKKIDQYK